MAAHVIDLVGVERSGERRHQVWPLLELLKDVARKLAASWDWYQTYHQTARELEGLSERELNDIGIARSDIPAIAMQSANTKHDR